MMKRRLIYKVHLFRGKIPVIAARFVSRKQSTLIERAADLGFRAVSTLASRQPPVHGRRCDSSGGAYSFVLIDGRQTERPHHMWGVRLRDESHNDGRPW